MLQIEELFTVFWQSLLLPAAAAAITCYIILRLLPRHGVALAGLLACAAGFYAASEFNSTVQYRLNTQQPVTLSELGRTMAIAVTQAGSGSKPPVYYWLPWAGLVAGLASLVVRLASLPVWLAWLIRIAVAALAARLFTYNLPATWPCIALGAMMVLIWVLIEKHGKAYPGGLLPFTVAICFFAASAVILHANSARFAEIALALGACWLGISFVCWRRAADGGGAAGIAGVLVPGIMLITHSYQAEYSTVPLRSYFLAAAAPLLLGLALLARTLGRTTPRMQLLGAIPTIALALAAVIDAALAAPIQLAKEF